MRREENQLNVLGSPLKPCGYRPLTGFFRDGFCRTCPEDIGLHGVCAQVTAEFLEFSKSRGNDLITPRPELRFPGLKPGDRWCLCASRWKEAWEAGFAPPVILEATSASVLQIIPQSVLVEHALEIGP